MSTVGEIQIMFTDLRGRLTKRFGAEQAKFGVGQEDKKEEAVELYGYLQMGLFAAESLIVDIKRIANALDGGNPTVRQGVADSLYDISTNTTPKG